MNAQKQISLESKSVASGVTGQVPPVENTLEVAPPTDQQELQNLSTIIKTWRDLNKESSTLKEQVREKTKRMKALEEMILRIMKKNNIGALDLKESGGRILYKRASAKEGLTPKNLQGLLATHMKSEEAAAAALKYINDHRGAKVRESLLYERE
jgi:transcriptional accessory protein Tex/SPT6